MDIGSKQVLPLTTTKIGLHSAREPLRKKIQRVFSIEICSSIKKKISAFFLISNEKFLHFI